MMTEGNNIADATLAHESWEPCSVHAVILAYLRAEWEKHLTGSFPLCMIGDRRIIDEADLGDAVQNNLRSTLLWLTRGALLRWIPTDTRWFEVCHLRQQHFHQIRAINCSPWTSPTDSNELEKVAGRTRIDLRKPPAEWPSPILWGHDRHSALTILEGNNRLTALAGSDEGRGCALTVYVGLSTRPCPWHLPDVPKLSPQG